MTPAAPVAVLRCDAGPRVGAGHLVRCLALASGLRRAGARPFLLTGPLPGVWRSMIASHRVPLEEREGLEPGVSGHDAAGDFCQGRPGLVVLDDYGVDAGWVTGWKQRAPFVALVADHGTDHGADAVVDHNLSARAEDYPGASLRLLGPSFALLREEFRAPPVPRPGTGPPVVLLSLGGSAAGGLLPRILEGLEATALPMRARVIAGPHDPRLPGGPSTETRGRVAVEWLGPRPMLRPELERADLAVLAAGGVRFEAARLGVPLVLGILADNQQSDAWAFAEAGLALTLGWWDRTEPAELGRVLRSLLLDEPRRRAMASRGPETVDGRGAERAGGKLLAAAGQGPR